MGMLLAGALSDGNFMYYFDDRLSFVIEDYNRAKPLSDFFPGIAGMWGIPMWVFYVNRNQAIVSAGVRDKDHSVLEFHSFNRALGLVGREGFRTFIRTKGLLFEPFVRRPDKSIFQKMTISSEELEIFEKGLIPGLEVRVTYFPIVERPVAGLVRKLELTNTGRKKMDLELCDGLPRILPCGVSFQNVKFIARHIEGMMGVFEIKGIPLFRLKQTPRDEAKVGQMEGGNYYFASVDGKIIKDAYLVDPEPLFLSSSNYDFPWGLEKNTIKDILRTPQVRENKTPCAFSLLELKLLPGEKKEIYSVLGNSSTEARLKTFLDEVLAGDFFTKARGRNTALIEEIKDSAFTVSGNPLFDEYCRQTFLDNVIRGGRPVVFNTKSGKSVFYLYSRQNGDLERDYHYFVLDSTYLSQGNGHYRSVNQNRRTDCWFFPEIYDANLKIFMGLIQTDGYNPLVIECVNYLLSDLPGYRKWLGKLVRVQKKNRLLSKFEKKAFSPGEFIMALEDNDIKVPGDKIKIISDLLSFCREDETGGLHEGFWVDHFTYNLDLLENLLMVYPEKLRDVLLGRKEYTFFDDPDIVLPRDRKLVLSDGKVRQYESVLRAREKTEIIKSREKDPYRVRETSGRVYQTTLFVKFLCIAVNRTASLDPFCLGLEMEAGKPGWNDSMNGLPGILGSSLCEALELLRLHRKLAGVLSGLDVNEKISVYEELAEFMAGLLRALKERNVSRGKKRDFLFWEKSHSLLEDYRKKTRLGLTGKEKVLRPRDFLKFTGPAVLLLEELFSPARERQVFNKNGVPYTYYINEAKRFERHHCSIRVKEFANRPIALFLEGPVHMLKVAPHLAPGIYKSVRRSGIYDEKLKMYKSCESLKKETFEIGRVTAYPAGWIENESVYTHMEYKYMLEVLRAGLYTQFFRDMKNVFMPYLKPEVYGRSPMENVSFIASSALSARGLHGQGFQPRLSGVTGELLHIWLLLVAGPEPFYLEEGKLKFGLRPILNEEFFTREKKAAEFHTPDGKKVKITIPENSFAFRFMNRTLVTYLNPARKDTFGTNAALVKRYTLFYSDGRKLTVAGASLDTKYALDLRNGLVPRLEVNL